MTEILFSNSSDSAKFVWVEPLAYPIELDGQTEYRLVTHETTFAIDYTSGNQFTLRLDNSIYFTLYKRSLQAGAENLEWTVDIDFLDQAPSE
jgi:hypothetical protein